MEVGVPPTLRPCNLADSCPLCPPPVSSLAVSISDVESVREGQESELLRSLAEELPLEQGFTIVFHGRRSNLDLVANSAEEAKIWMQGLQLLVDFVTGMDQQERLDQYQQDGVRVGGWRSLKEPDATRLEIGGGVLHWAGAG